MLEQEAEKASGRLSAVSAISEKQNAATFFKWGGVRTRRKYADILSIFTPPPRTLIRSPHRG